MIVGREVNGGALPEHHPYRKRGAKGPLRQPWTECADSAPFFLKQPPQMCLIEAGVVDLSYLLTCEGPLSGQPSLPLYFMQMDCSFMKYLGTPLMDWSPCCCFLGGWPGFPPPPGGL